MPQQFSAPLCTRQHMDIRFISCRYLTDVQQNIFIFLIFIYNIFLLSLQCSEIDFITLWPFVPLSVDVVVVEPKIFTLVDCKESNQLSITFRHMFKSSLLLILEGFTVVLVFLLVCS